MISFGMGICVDVVRSRGWRGTRAKVFLHILGAGRLHFAATYHLSYLFFGICGRASRSICPFSADTIFRILTNHSIVLLLCGFRLTLDGEVCTT